MVIRDSKEIIKDLKKLVRSEGYIYTLCLIIMDDFHFEIEKLHEVNYWERLNKNEVSLILGLLIQENILLVQPKSPLDLIDLKNRTYSLMEELHHSTNKPMIEKFKHIFENQDSVEKTSKKDFWGGENSFIEPIFYAGDGIYDFQYLEYLEKKYKYDETWLREKKSFKFEEVCTIVSSIKELHQDKIGKVNFLGLKENKSKLLKELKKDKSLPKEARKVKTEEFLSMMEFYQFYELFNTDNHIKNGFLPEQISESGWDSFYNGLLNLLCISPNEFDSSLNITSFLNNFSIQANANGVNKHFKNIGDFNLFTAKPIIELENNKYFVPSSFCLHEAIYESPYYWMLEDKEYLGRLSDHRGKVGEEITYELLKKVFGSNRVFQSVRIESKKGHDDSDIDVLCVLGSKALCVQVKSKKLTQLSRKGSFEQLKKDFKGAVQDAYNQGIICRERILENSATFYNSDGDKIKLSEDIEEVYILGVTTENYPTLTHQTSIFLEKEENSPHPLFITIFDLELVLFYLDNPYDFLYYVRQRIDLMDYFNANEEIHFLGYHLIHKLWKDDKVDYKQIDPSIGQLIDRNYYPFKLGIKTSSRNDKIRNRWKNEDFETLCNQIGNLTSPKVTDVIFHLLDWSEQSRDNLVRLIKETKAKTQIDNAWHNFSLMAGPERSSFGLSYISWGDNNSEEFMRMLLKYSRARKYKSKADYWIGIGSTKDSRKFVNGFVFNDKKWKYDEFLEEEIKDMFDGDNKGLHIKYGKKIGRNEPCPCSSGKKYKRCCGRLN
ncbi:SEC-C metal-binding domain-containing protein [Marinifilum sp. D714]|uniref:SEC-C metal-binding domain-containing protein n=1 Tax=Marinifilum sp. D714 TaxID=2937523 RepID=UPI0027CFA7D5|nr:SEC-C metal-binding domain-containing protein [Marinifilum sp. D714]MDQ2178322.1 SEC-C domain-containing protein [Marinifilum sp. D714]